MVKNANRLRAISRRDTLKVCLVPAAGAISAHWLIGCADDKSTGLNPSGTAQSGVTAGAGSNTTAGSSSSALAGVNGGQMTARAGAQSTAASSGSGAASGTIAGKAGASGTAAAGNGGQGSAGMLAQAGRSGSGGSMATMDVPWATGGTKSITGNYPDPFAGSSAGTMCKLYPTQTLGPCYAQMPMMRSDISDGLGGLPMRISLLVVRGSCMPVPGATVDIWHAGSAGFYSSYATGTVCNPGTEDARMKTFGRGVQTTDENGKVEFSTVFPGWYTGRTIHIHFTVRVNGNASVTSQLYFEDALDDEILAQGDYKSRGKRDTSNATDNTFKSGGATPDQILFAHAKRPDGVLHAWKVLSIG